MKKIYGLFVSLVFAEIINNDDYYNPGNIMIDKKNNTIFTIDPKIDPMIPFTFQSGTYKEIISTLNGTNRQTLKSFFKNYISECSSSRLCDPYSDLNTLSQLIKIDDYSDNEIFNKIKLARKLDMDAVNKILEAIEANIKEYTPDHKAAFEKNFQAKFNILTDAINQYEKTHEKQNLIKQKPNQSSIIQKIRDLVNNGPSNSKDNKEKSSSGISR